MVLYWNVSSDSILGRLLILILILPCHFGKVPSDADHNSQDIIITGQIGKEEEPSHNRYNSSYIIYDGCLSLKACHAPIDKVKLGVSVDCILSLNCEFVWALGKQPIHQRERQIVAPEHDEIVVEIFATTLVWAAVGVSTDQQMGHDFVLECVKENDAVKMYTSWNVVKTYYIQRLHGNHRVIVKDVAKLVFSKYHDGSVYCRVHVKKVFSVSDPETLNTYYFDFTKNKYCMLAAYGDRLTIKEGQVTGLGPHENGKLNGKAVCTEFIFLTHQRTPSRNQVTYLQSHGGHMVIAYLGILSTSIFVARYYQKTFGSNTRYKNVELWLWIHGIFGVYVTGGTFVSVIHVAILVRQWSGALTFPFHKFGGIVATLLIIVSALTGFYIRKTDDTNLKYPVVYVIHGFCGHSAFVLSTFIITLSSHVAYAFVPCVTPHWVMVFAVLYLLFHGFMSTSSYWLRKCRKVRNNANNDQDQASIVRVSTFFSQNILHRVRVSTVPVYVEKETRKIRLYLLAGYICFTWFFAILIAHQITASRESCSLPDSEANDEVS